MPNVLLSLALLASLVASALTPAHHDAGTPSGASTDTTTSANPFTAYTWGVYKGPMEPSWTAYRQASGSQRKLLGYIAHTPKDHWFGHWNDNDKVAAQGMDTLIELGPPVAPQLYARLQESQPEMRAAVADVLGVIGGEAALPSLQAVTEDKDPEVAAAAKRAIERIKAAA